MRMKKSIMVLMITALILTAGSIQANDASAKGRGGVMGFIAGCCFGTRAGGDYNSGKEICWREWVRVFVWPLMIWDGIEGAQGMTTADYAKTYGSNYY